MHLSTTVLLLSSSLALTHAATNHWCGSWAGAPKPNNVPSEQQLPNKRDLTLRYFTEPQLSKFSPPLGLIERVQVPKIWGNDDFRLALMSYATTEPAIRIYSSSKSRWTDVYEALELLMDECVTKGSGGAYLVPPSPGLKQGTLVLYAYAVGSQFDFQMNYYMTNPFGINPATLGRSLAAARIPVSAAFDLNETAIAAPPESAALAASAPAGYSYLGCFTDVPTRTLSAANATSEKNTPLVCSQFCPDSQYFGVEFGAECHCGQALNQASVRVGGGCDSPCAGDAKQACGGPFLLSVYKKGTQTS